MKTIKVFLASSIDELRKDRAAVGDFFRLLDDGYIEYGIHFNLVKCENYDTAISCEGKQSEYDNEIADSEFCFFLFANQVGDYTKHELEVAFNCLKTTGSPAIYVFFKVDGVNGKIENGVSSFAAELKENRKQYNIYKSMEDLYMLMLVEIRKYTRTLGVSEPPMSITNGRVCVDNRVVVSIDKIVDPELAKLCDGQNNF